MAFLKDHQPQSEHVMGLGRNLQEEVDVRPCSVQRLLLLTVRRSPSDNRHAPRPRPPRNI